jgi:hypothetical protein
MSSDTRSNSRTDTPARLWRRGRKSELPASIHMIHHLPSIKYAVCTPRQHILLSQCRSNEDKVGGWTHPITLPLVDRDAGWRVRLNLFPHNGFSFPNVTGFFLELADIWFVEKSCFHYTWNCGLKFVLNGQKLVSMEQLFHLQHMKNLRLFHLQHMKNLLLPKQEFIGSNRNLCRIQHIKNGSYLK